ncbi:MAG: B12-binding domain-containing radical SAM protein [Paracoccaceae bacterium]|nr:B12-binding domain-containing radical SAM protein [Paracoccaceae bacterium]
MDRKLKIFLGDLSYINEENRFNLFVPLNIGYIASYAHKMFGNQVEIKLFKDPNELLQKLEEVKPDVLGLSFSYWNTKLNHVVSRKAKELFGNKITTVWGGPSVDTDTSQQIGLFQRFPYVDAFVTNEGELGFSNLIEQRLAEDVQEMWSKPINGIVHLNENELIKGINVGLSLDLSTLDSPYLTGLLDPFLNGQFLPMLQTSRLCPYTCTFCVSGKNKGKLRAFPDQQVIDEVKFITKHFHDKPHLPMHIVDENFGILKRDAALSDFILETSKEFGYPKGLFFYNDKRFSDTAKHVINNLGHMTLYGMALSLQTENPETLKEIKRRNLTSEQIDEAITWAAERNLPSTTELIFGLPYETKDSFVSFLNNALRRGFDSILVNNLYIVDGIEMARDGYRDKHGLKTRFRLTSANQGLIGGEFCAEYEEVVVGSNCISLDDFKFMRTLNFMFYGVFSLSFYKWFFQFVRHSDIPLADYIAELIKLPSHECGETEWQRFIRKFEKAAMDELYSSPEDLHNSAYKAFRSNNDQAPTPSLLNVYYGAQMICLDKIIIKEALLTTLDKFSASGRDNAMFKKANFLIEVCEAERINLFESEKPNAINTFYDLPQWKRDKFKRPLSSYRIKKTEINFVEQAEFRLKFPEFQKSFSGLDKKSFYFNALQFMVPRTQLLYEARVNN